MKSMLPLPAVALLALAGCAAPAETAEQAATRIANESATAKATIDSLAREFGVHFNAGHADVVANSFYAENGMVMPPNEPARTGRSEIQASLGAFMAMKAQLTVTPVDVVANGAIAIDRGTYTVTFTPPGATAPVTDNGKYLAHWHLIDGKWLMVADIWNSDLPPMPMAPPAK